MPYTPEKPRLTESSDQLRERVPGWGVDLDPSDRPSVPRLRFDPAATGAHWHEPEQQPETTPRERSIEHTRLPPVFGTTGPLHGLSGVIRRYAYANYSEGRAAHWLLLLAGDRVDAIESAVRSFGTLRPDNPVTQTGVLSEFKRHPFRSRFGQGRADLNHQWIDPLLVAAPWAVAGGAAYGVVKSVTAGVRRARKSSILPSPDVFRKESR